MPSADLPPSTSHRAAAVGLGLTVLVFGAAVAAATLRLRSGLREQILNREAATLAAVASMQLDNSAASTAPPRWERCPARSSSRCSRPRASGVSRR